MAHSTAPEPTSTGVPHPLPAGPGILVHPAADRRLAVSHWLLSTLPDHERHQARAEWDENRITLLRLGTLFSAVRLPAALIAAAAGGRPSGADVDEFLEAALDGGPVICDPRHRVYYALVPASVPRSWSAALDDWRRQDVDALGRDSFLGVPRPDRIRTHAVREPFWAVPMESAGVLCPALSVARLIAAGVHHLADGPAPA